MRTIAILLALLLQGLFTYAQQPTIKSIELDPPTSPVLATLHLNSKPYYRYTVRESMDLKTWATPAGPVYSARLALDTAKSILLYTLGRTNVFYRIIETAPADLTILNIDSPFAFVVPGQTVTNTVRFHSTKAVIVHQFVLLCSRYGHGGDEPIERIVVRDGTETIATIEEPNGMETIECATAIVVDGDKTITIETTPNQIEAGKSSSGDSFSVNIWYQDSATVIEDVQTGQPASIDGYISSSQRTTVFKTIPTIKQIPLPVPGIDTLGVNTGGLLQYAITAPTNGAIGIGKMSFAVSGFGIGDVTLGVRVFADQELTQSVGTGQLAQPITVTPNSVTNSVAMFYPETNGGRTILVIPAGTTYYFRVDGGFGDRDSASITTTLLTEEGSAMGTFDDIDLWYTFLLWTPNSGSQPSTFSGNDWFDSFGLPGMWPDGISQTRTN